MYVPYVSLSLSSPCVPERCLLRARGGRVGVNFDEEVMTVASCNPPSTGRMLKEGGGGDGREEGCGLVKDQMKRRW
jgi:hypothetical protein